MNHTQTVIDAVKLRSLLRFPDRPNTFTGENADLRGIGRRLTKWRVSALAAFPADRRGGGLYPACHVVFYPCRGPDLP